MLLIIAIALLVWGLIYIGPGKRVVLVFAVGLGIVGAANIVGKSGLLQAFGDEISGRQYAEVRVATDPENAAVFVDGKTVGRTPTTVTVVRAQATPYRVMADEPYDDYDLYKPFEGVLNVTSERESISVWLERTTAEEQAAQRQRAEEERRRAAEAAEQRRREAEQAAQRRRIANAVFIIENWSWGRSYDNYIVEGQVTNNTDAVIRHAKALIEFYDSAGTFLSSDWTYLDFTTLAPRQSTPFKAYADYNPLYKSARLHILVDNRPMTTIRRQEIE
ncbi:MAG: FxLYD domain-containing protein [Trueperaceae bacterium]